MMKIVNKKKFIYFLSFIFIFLIVFCLAAGYFFVRSQVITPAGGQSTEETFVIKKGESVRKIAAHLEEAGLIKDKIWFVWYVFYKGWTTQLKAGQYELSPAMNIPQIARRIAKGEAISQETEVTIPEGFNLKQIDVRLAQVGLIHPGDLIKRPQLEGYLFPDTYRFDRNTSLEEIIAKMRENFDRKLDKELKDEIARQGKTVKEIIIMASLLEREVPTYSDQQLVSGIFWQRLKINYPLESCATIAYILGVDKWRYSIEDTRIESPYNTYLNIGLPPGPINNPGLSTIRAAIYPQESDYNFFLSKPDGQTVFSRTLEEHNQNKAKYLQ